ncbi:MAG: GNAT family N-acetyltransferase [Chloroflexi bacterium]|nr:GNAT family N-acetyltransferase [Chloroflexota bacterium]
MTQPIPPTTIRRADATDAERLARIDRDAWEHAYRGLVPDAALDEWIAESPAHWRTILTTMDPDAPQRQWVAERATEVIGYATTSPARAMWLEPPAGAGELTNLYLAPAVIGSGAGRRLFEHAMTDLHERGFDPLLVWAFRDNPLAHRFYRRMGLVIDVPHHTWVLDGVACPIVRFTSAVPERDAAVSGSGSAPR